jgi:hypothetical protein
LNHPEQKDCETPFSPNTGHSGAHLQSEARQEAEIRKITVLGQPRPLQKNFTRPHLTGIKTGHGGLGTPVIPDNERSLK